MQSRIFIGAMLFLSATLAFSYQDVRELSLSAQGISKLEIECGAGTLEVLGKDGVDEIKVTAEIVVRGLSQEKAERFVQQEMKLSLEKIGTKALLVSKFKNLGFRPSTFFSLKEKQINLTVVVPKKMSLVVDDGSGSMRIGGIAGKVEIEDGSGNIYAEDIGGDMVIDDGSGEMELRDISGDVKIDDGSGGIDIEKILGSVSIDDGSGTIYVRDVQGEVIVSDGSGSIHIDGVERDVTIKRDGSGGVDIKNVKGKITK